MENRTMKKAFCFLLSLIMMANIVLALPFSVNAASETKSSGLKIVSEPADVRGILGDFVSIQVVAEGEGLTYQWYYKDPIHNRFYTSEIKSDTYRVKATADRNGRQVYCVVKDKKGKTVTSGTATITVEQRETLQITNSATKVGGTLNEFITVDLKIRGDNLTYVWYYKDVGSKSFTRSTITDSVYRIKLTEERLGREVRCVATDAWGNTVTSDPVMLVALPDLDLEITSQLSDQTATLGTMTNFTVGVQGYGLTYQWYYKDPSHGRFYKSEMTTDTYKIKATAERNGRQVYCVITDAYGKTETTETVTLNVVPKETLEIVSQPTYEPTVLGGKFVVKMDVKGDDLTYTWYYKDVNSTKFYKSSITESQYTLTATEARNGRQLYCLITDALGNQVQTQVITLAIGAAANTSENSVIAFINPTENNTVPAGGISMSNSNGKLSAIVPEGVLLNPGTEMLVLSVKEMDESNADITLHENEKRISLDVHIEGIAKGNALIIQATIKEALPRGLNMGNYRFYHVEGETTVEMVRLADGETPVHNSYWYDPATGDITLFLKSFSEVALVADTENKWEGEYDYTWYDPDKTELFIANADQLAAFGAIVGGMAPNIARDDFSEKTVKLLADINLGDKIFCPIGYFYTDDSNQDGSKNDPYSTVYAFKGTFDGNGHTVSNFYQNTWEIKGNYGAEQYYKDAMGLFGYVVNGTVKNLSVDSFSSDGEFTPTGVIAAYAVNSTFENISITNCNPRVYNTGNGGIVGIGGNSTDTSDKQLIFKNITIDNTNKISALWGSWDVACGGVMGMFRGYGKVHFENCHVAAQIDVYNDVCGNYQYYWYRYAGMMIGSLRGRNTTDENGYTVPDMTGITAENCTVHFGDWNDYYYCELVANTLASYTHDHQFSRLTEISSLDEIKSGDSWTKAGNFLLISGDVKTCYHIVNDNGVLRQHLHTDSGEETVNGKTVLKEDNQIVYLPFNQLFQGDGWGVKHIPIYNGEDYAFDGITILDRETADSVVKFEKNETAQDVYLSGTAVTLGELFKAAEISDPKLTIKPENVQVTVSPAGEGSTAFAVYVPNASDWKQGTLTFYGSGEAVITITDYYFCTKTTIHTTLRYSEGLEFTENGDGTYSVSGIGTCTDTDISIPPTYEGLPVTQISAKAFYQKTNLTSVIIPDGVTTISDRAFQECSSLEKIRISSTVTSIHEGAFRDCGNLGTIEVDGKNTVYRSEGNCLIKKSTNALVAGCKNSVIPEGVKQISLYAFDGCSGLTEIKIPSTVTRIGTYAFRGCAALDKIEVDSKNTVYRSEGNCLIEISTNALIVGCNQSVIPEGVTSISSYAFFGRVGLTTIKIPDTVSSIGQMAFQECTNLVSINIPSSVTVIGQQVFNYCSGLKEITIPDGVTSIGNRAFAGCSGLTEIIIPESVTSIGNNAFYQCSGLTEISISNGVTSIGSSAFSGCSGLTEIIIPDSVTSIGSSAFSSCSGLTEVIMSENVTVIESSVFSFCRKLEKISIPAGVTSIGKSAFNECEKLTEIVIPDSVTDIGEKAFYYCQNLESVSIPDSVTSIGNNAFAGCNKLKNIQFTGTTAQWLNNITFGSNWNASTGNYTVYCTNGSISKNGK